MHNIFKLFLIAFIVQGCNANPKDGAKKAKGNPEIITTSACDTFPKHGGSITDLENIYTTQEKITLDSLMKNVMATDDIVIAIVTLDTTYINKNNLDNYITKLHNCWGVGYAEKNNGILIGISKSNKLIRISNGYGIEDIITDAETKIVLDKHFTSAFKKNKFYDGTYAGIIELRNLIRTKKVAKN